MKRTILVAALILCVSVAFSRDYSVTSPSGRLDCNCPITSLPKCSAYFAIANKFLARQDGSARLGRKMPPLPLPSCLHPDAKSRWATTVRL